MQLSSTSPCHLCVKLRYARSLLFHTGIMLRRCVVRLLYLGNHGSPFSPRLEDRPGPEASQAFARPPLVCVSSCTVCLLLISCNFLDLTINLLVCTQSGVTKISQH